MHDWMFEPGHDPLTLPEQPWSPAPGAASWFPPAPADDVQTWLFETAPKGSLDDFGPMFIDGPAELDEVIVTGRRPEANVWFPHHSMTSYDGNAVWEFNEEMFTGEYLWGDGALVDPYNSCEDRRADTLADDINDEISRQSDRDRREYGALIWRDDAGNLHRTALVPGTNEQVDWPADPSTLGLDSYSRVVGMVHSHPTMVDLGGGRWVPATHTGIHGGDWAAADGWVTMHNLDRANFTMYISDRGTVREYDYADNTSNSRQADRDQGSVESGDYHPGSSCP